MSIVSSSIARRRRTDSWVTAATAIVALELLFAAAMNLKYGRSASLPLLDYLFVFGSMTLGVCPLIVLWWTWTLRRSERPGSDLLAKLLSVPAGPILIGLPLLAIHFSALTWVKPVLPMVGGFSADPMLAQAEGFLVDPWRVAHVVAGPRNAVIDWLYAAWFPVCIGTFSFVLFSFHRSRVPVIVSFFLTTAACMMFQFAFPSAGPVFYALAGHGDRFADLGPNLPPLASHGAEYLWRYHVGEDIGRFIGISAMPSVHVALAAWVAIATRQMWPPVFPCALVWAGLIGFGSVYLGWHYALDGVAGAILALLAYKAVEQLAVGRSDSLMTMDDVTQTS